MLGLRNGLVKNLPNNKPTIYIAIPTGPPKAYALLYMLASLKNLDYPPSKISVNFGVTHHGSANSEAFLQQLKQLLSASNFKCKTSIQTTHPTQEDFDRWGSYYGVILNVHALRLSFLQSKTQYFWLLGGDNPPPRGTLKNLLKTKGDVVSASVNQRSSKKKEYKINQKLCYPIYWQYIWKPKDIPMDLEPSLRDTLRTAWTEFSFLDTPPRKDGERFIHNCVFGSGCSLVRREVLEYVGYYLGSGGTHSEDLHFCNLVNLRGFDTVLDLDTRCLHFDEDGTVY